MSGECDRCGEHALECVCRKPSEASKARASAIITAEENRIDEWLGTDELVEAIALALDEALGGGERVTERTLDIVYERGFIACRERVLEEVDHLFGVEPNALEQLRAAIKKLEPEE